MSFLAGLDTVTRLLAGCSVNPATVGDLLVATDVYEPGLTDRVMAELMAFDKAVRSQGPAFVQDAVDEALQGNEPLAMTFQVIDEVTEREAFRPSGRLGVVFDLEGKTIRHSAAIDLPAAGEVRIQQGDSASDRTVAYFLPSEWTIESW